MDCGRQHTLSREGEEGSGATGGRTEEEPGGKTPFSIPIVLGRPRYEDPDQRDKRNEIKGLKTK